MSGDGLAPAEAIRRQRDRLGLLDDDEVLRLLRTLDPLPDADDDDAAWANDETFDRAYRLVAIGDEIGRRRLVEGISGLYERMALGDGFEMMEGFRHGAEAAVDGNWPLLSRIMRDLAKNPRAGTRRWAVRELGFLREPDALPEVIEATHDDEPLVRSEALSSLRMLADPADPSTLEEVRTALLDSAMTDPSPDLRYEAAGRLAELDPEAEAPVRRPPPPEPFWDPTWKGDASGREGAEATRRVIRSLITGALAHPTLDAYLAETGRVLVMTPGTGVYPAREPDSKAADQPPDWRASIVLWLAGSDQHEREPSPLTAEIELRRASSHEVRARLLDVVAHEIAER
jgi:hypothetical protein